MNWEDERYVRLYVRDTGDWCALSWDGQALLMQLLRKADRAGVLQLGKRGRSALAAMLAHANESERIDAALTELLNDGCVELHGHYLVIPNFTKAQESKQSDKQRQQDSREKRLAQARSVTELTNQSQPVTPGHARSQSVTLAVPSVPSVLSCAEPAKPEEAKASILAGGSSPTTPARSQIALLPDEPKPARKTRERKPRTEADEQRQAASAAVWTAYAREFEARHRIPPTRNARVNGQIAQFIARVPVEDAPAIAAFYVWHSNAFYVGQLHPIGLLLRDAEKLRAEWQRGETANMETARRNECTEANPFAQELMRRQRERAQRGEVIEARSDDEDRT